MHFKNKVVVVTGASSGLGRETAKELAAKGASVVLSGRNEDALKEVTREITEAGGRAAFVRADLMIKEDIDRLVREAVRAFGPLDCFILNAGTSHAAKNLTELTEADIRRVIE